MTTATSGHDAGDRVRLARRGAGRDVVVRLVGADGVVAAVLSPQFAL